MKLYPAYSHPLLLTFLLQRIDIGMSLLERAKDENFDISKFRKFCKKRQLFVLREQGPLFLQVLPQQLALFD